jgi:hypothetical protein
MMRVSKTGIVRITLLCLSALFVWDARSGATFAKVFEGPFKDAIELSTLAALPGSVVFLGIAIYDLIRRRTTVLRGALSVLLTIFWCLILWVSSVVIMARTAL